MLTVYVVFIFIIYKIIHHLILGVFVGLWGGGRRALNYREKSENNYRWQPLPITTIESQS